MATYLGVDAGATHARWALIDDEGRELRRGEGPPIQAASMPLSEASSRLRTLLVRIGAESSDLPRPAAAVAGIAGVGDAALRVELERACAPMLAVRVTGDPAVAASAALADGPGIALWAGTGSFAVARDAEGGLWRIGGRGPLLGDEGSGYDLVRNAAVSVARAADRLAQPTALTSPLVEHFGACSALRLGASMSARTPAEVAAALPVVLEAAAGGDTAALEVLRVGASRLAMLAGALAERASLAFSLPVALGGGVLGGSDRFADLVAEQLRSRGFGTAERARRDAAHGAAVLARAVHLGQAPLNGWLIDGTA